MNINKKELFGKVESLVDQLVLLVEEYKLTDKAEYNDYLNVLVKLTLAAGQAPIEKITHATALIGMLQLRMQGNEKMDQLANSGMKLSIGNGKMEISYGKTPEVSSIAKETTIDLTQMDSKMAELNQLCSNVNPENTIKPQSSPNNGGILDKSLARLIEKKQAESGLIFNAVVVTLVHDERSGSIRAGVRILGGGFVQAYWFDQIEVWRDNVVCYRADHEVRVHHKLDFADTNDPVYDYLINIPRFKLRPGDLIKFV